MTDLLTDQPSEKIRGHCRAHYLNLCMILYEILFESEKLSNKSFNIEGETSLKQALSHGRGVILFAPHMGNFFYYYWLLTQKYNCLTVATAGSQELRPIYLLYQSLGCKGLDYDAISSLELIRSLKRHLNQNGIVLLLGDFWRPSFPVATFFNRATRSPSGTALFSLQHKVPVIPFYGYCKKGFAHQLNFLPPLYLFEEFEPNQLREATDKLNSILEEIILTHPEQWFYWFNVHERWEKSVVEHDTGDATVA